MWLKNRPFCAQCSPLYISLCFQSIATILSLSGKPHLALCDALSRSRFPLPIFFRYRPPDFGGLALKPLFSTPNTLSVSGLQLLFSCGINGFLVDRGVCPQLLQHSKIKTTVFCQPLVGEVRIMYDPICTNFLTCAKIFSTG